MHDELVDAPQPGSLDETVTVLLVDDEPSVLKALRRVLLDENHRLLTAPNTSDALKVLEHGKAVLTGHLVLTTLHTNSSIATLPARFSGRHLARAWLPKLSQQRLSRTQWLF